MSSLVGSRHSTCQAPSVLRRRGSSVDSAGHTQLCTGFVVGGQGRGER